MNNRNGEIKDGRTKEQIRELASKFISRECGPASLITVTRVDFNHKDNSAIILFSVLPDHKKDEALDFLKRKRSEFRQYMTDNSGFGRIPFIDFVLDLGEKNRQLIEEISQKAQKMLK